MLLTVAVLLFVKVRFAASRLPVAVFLLPMIFLSHCGGSRTTSWSDVPADAPLRQQTDRVRIGTVIQPDAYDGSERGAKYEAIVRDEFDSVQVSWIAKYGGSPERGRFEFGELTQAVTRIESQGQAPHVHVLFGSNGYEPDWLINGASSGLYDAAELEELMRERIDAIVSHERLGERIKHWNVTNELFADDTGKYYGQDNLAWLAMGWEPDNSGLTGSDRVNERHPVFIRRALEYLRTRTNGRLELRDYSIETPAPEAATPRPGLRFDLKHKAFYQLMRHLKRSNVPVDVVGIQGHYDIGKLEPLLRNDNLRRGIERYRGLGVDVQITELDISTESAEVPWNDTLRQQQRLDYRDAVKQMVLGGVKELHVWGVADGLDPGWKTRQHPLPWDENMNRKPAWEGIRDALVQTR